MVMKTTFFFFIEGNNDEIFFQEIFESLVKKKFDFVKYILWAHQKKLFLKNLIQHIKSHKYKEFLFISDFDLNQTKCFTHKKTLIQKKYDFIDEEQILIVKAEIESWICAGIPMRKQTDFNLSKLLYDTETLTKEEFEKHIPVEFEPKSYFFDLLLEKYSISTAKGRNRSFKYVYEKIDKFISSKSYKFNE